MAADMRTESREECIMTPIIEAPEKVSNKILR